MEIRNLLEHKRSHVLSVRPGDTVSKVAELLTVEKIGAAVVTDDQGKIAGIVSERDVVRGLHGLGPRIMEQPVANLMTAEVVTCPPTASVADAVTLMDTNRIRHIPIAEDGIAIGMISMRDVVSVRLAQLELDVEVLREQLITGAK